MNPTDNTLFSDTPGQEPLAARMRPRTLDEFVGQDHIMGEGRLLRRAIAADMLSSVIFSGPPGTGKTTLARVIANTTRSRFVSLNAVLSGVKEVRAEIETAREQMAMHERRTILFVDEVHRWNKAQQDGLLPWVENGTVILIGATTENPFFEVNAALVSRSRIFQLRPLTTEDLKHVVARTLADPVRGYGSLQIAIDPDALTHLLAVADGDARSLLNALQLAVETSVPSFPPPGQTPIRVTLEIAEESIQAKALLYDREGDYHYDSISAFIKSLRGSDPDAALYWMARMVAAGENPRFLFRRMLILAAEDVGLADPNALVVVEAAARAFDRVGLPEGQFLLSQAALYLSTCEKSNSTLGFFDARASVEKEVSRDVPRHLRDGNRDKEGFGHGEGYLYPHAYRDHWVAQAYLPTGLQGRLFYTPSRCGYEARIADSVERRREIQMSVVWDDDAGQEILTFSPPDNERDRWLVRLSQSRSAVLEKLRERLFSIAELQRHDRVLIAGRQTETLVWEALRHTPEGHVSALVETEAQAEQIRFHSGKLETLTRPLVCVSDGIEIAPSPDCPDSALWHGTFDVVIGRNLLQKRPDKPADLRRLATLARRVILADNVARETSRLSLVLADALAPRQLEALTEAERRVYEAPDDPMVNWKPEELVAWYGQAGFTNVGWESLTHTTRRTITASDLDKWILAPGARLGGVLDGLLGQQGTREMVDLLKSKLPPDGVDWRSSILVTWADSAEQSRDGGRTGGIGKGY